MRAVVGALAYCQANDRRLIIDWPEKEPSETLGTFPARFSDLWSNDIEQTDCKRRFPGLRLENAGILNNAPDRLELRTCHIEPFLPWMPENKPGPFSQILTPTDNVYDATDEMVGSIANYAAEGAELSMRSGQMHIHIPGIVGVNIRYALKQPCIPEPEWFAERMQAFPDATQFFCSFDSLFVESIIYSDFSPRMHFQRKDYAYDRAGIIKTCADLYILAACDYVIGSNYSSYSQMVAFMRGAQYVGPHDKPKRGLIGGRYEDLWNPPE